MKKIAIIPTLFTLGNAVCGFVAIALASKFDPDSADFVYAAWLIFAAMLFDALDGYVARLSKSSSDFGGQLDSLCDVVSFGVAPAYLLLRLGRVWEELVVVRQLVIGIAILYLVCAILRLARFNVDNTPDPASHKRFKGLPSPAAAGCIASLVLVHFWHWNSIASGLIQTCVLVGSIFGAFLVSVLMVSRLSYPHMANHFLGGRKHFSHLVQVILAVFVIAITRELAIAMLFWVYALFFPCRYMVIRLIRRHTAPAAQNEY